LLPDDQNAGPKSDEVPFVFDCQLNVYNFADMQKRAPARYGFLRFDPVNTCNLHCVYCHNHRSDAIIDADELATFLRSNVVEIAHFQVGCIMEPTMDKRLSDIIALIGSSPAKPTKSFMLQTNGLLLHRHDHAKMLAAGLDHLSVSLDTADPQMQKELRSGMSLQKVLRNVAEFKANCPTVEVSFISVVTRANIGSMESLVELGMGLGIKMFVFHELLYYPENNVVDHSRMPGLMLREGEFADLTERLKTRFGTEIALAFGANTGLDASAREMIVNSLYTNRNLPAAKLHA
jgi:molybdenum cofactor biosynthesis enzyme MoaA